MSLKYHQKTIDLILQSPFLKSGNLPSFSHRNKLLLEEKEKQYQIDLPESVREWFSLDTPLEIAHYEHGTPTIEDLQPFSETVVGSDIPRPSKNLWAFLAAEYVGQGHENIYFEIDGSDDPSIYVDIEDNWDNHKKYGPKLMRINERFSSFIYNHFWDDHTRRLFEHHLRMSHLPIPSLQIPKKYQIHFDKMKTRYKELSDDLLVRFYNNHVCIWAYKISSDEHGNIISTDNIMHSGDIQADSIESLSETIDYLWGDDKPVFKLNTFDDETSEFLQRLQVDKVKDIFQDIPDWIIESELALKLGATIPVISTTMREQLSFLANKGELEVKLQNDVRYYRAKSG